MGDEIKLVLRKPVQAHNETVSELTFGEITGGHLIACGNPVMYGKEGRRVDTAAMGRLIGALAGIPDSSVARMSAYDFDQAGDLVLYFLGTSTYPASSSASSPSAASTAA